MTPRELDTDRLLGALGELQRKERAELSRLEEQAEALAAREPERAGALEDRLMDELFSTPVASPLRAADAEGPKSFKDLRLAMPAAGSARARISRLAVAAATSVALAAAVLLWVRPPGAQPFEPSYTLVAPPGDAQSRSAEGSRSSVYSLSRTLEFVLRPSERYEGPLKVACYAEQDDGLVRLDPRVELDPAGGARVVLPGDMLRETLREGSWQLRFYIAPPSATTIDGALVRTRRCPSDTRCLSFAAHFVMPSSL